MRRFASALLIFSFAGCTNPLASDRRNVGLFVNDIVVPESVLSTGTLSLSLTVVMGGCSKFERFEISKKLGSAVIETRGTDALPGASCDRVLVWEKRTIDLSGPFGDPFTVTVIQPDGTALVRTVRIQ